MARAFDTALGTGGTKKTTTTNASSSSYANQSNPRSAYTLPASSLQNQPLSLTSPTRINTTSSSGSSANKSTTPLGSVSQAVVAGRADAVPQSNVNTDNSYYTVYDGTNRTAIDSKTGQVVGKASGAYNVKSNNTPTGGTGGGNTGSGGETSYPSSYSSSSGSNSSSVKTEQEDVLQKIKDLLAEQEKKAEEAYRAQLEEQYAKNAELWRDNADQINVNRKRASNFVNALYGPIDSGAGRTNFARIASNWMSDHNSNNRAKATNDATALNSYNTNLSNAYSTLASGYGNFVMPVYTNRQLQLDQLAQQERLNAMDYDYRRFLAGLNL